SKKENLLNKKKSKDIKECKFLYSIINNIPTFRID
ncbi:MAG: hypothetical protein ACI9AB_000230, partial [Urechidicola sp.]